MFSNQLVNHFIDTFSTNAVIPVVGWVEAIAETHLTLRQMMGFAVLYPSYAGSRLLKRNVYDQLDLVRVWIHEAHLPTFGNNRVRP
jgi:hypothetical protein